MTASFGETGVGGIRRSTITVTMKAAGSDGLLRVASALHRRQVDVVQVAYVRDATTATAELVIEATESRARATMLTLQNITGVTGCIVSACEADQPREAILI